MLSSFTDDAVTQEGERLTGIRARTSDLVHKWAIDEADEDMLVEMLGLDEDDLEDESLPLATGFDDRAIAARRRRAQARNVNRPNRK